MTDRQRQLIEGYLPTPPDPELEPYFDYYVEDMRGRAVKVHIQNIGFNSENKSIYQVRTEAGRLVHGPWECDSELFGGGWYTKANLYDNKEDCIHSEHSMYDDWEVLRGIQRKEFLI